ncbi:hypothetical protein [Flavobacterium sp. '19STA2R22 D10 B1']|uniref:hypothetical protein n=1 Tax=Flavobacterium aerium TaxID=3037261 RepID=UPI00278C6E23|nr:hypothetical protein [Flavobacterium sp. '19STA2R22 D10 B1']
MKSKLRKITIDNLEYLYAVIDKYNLGTQTNTLTVKVFLSGQKQTPLVIEFLTIGIYYSLGHDAMESPLISGINLTNKVTNVVEKINLNEPKNIRELILQGRKNGWVGSNKIENQNGLNYLIALGYEIDVLKPLN